MPVAEIKTPHKRHGWNLEYESLYYFRTIGIHGNENDLIKLHLCAHSGYPHAFSGPNFWPRNVSHDSIQLSNFTWYPLEGSYSYQSPSHKLIVTRIFHNLIDQSVPIYLFKEWLLSSSSSSVTTVGMPPITIYTRVASRVRASHLIWTPRPLLFSLIYSFQNDSVKTRILKQLPFHDSYFVPNHITSRNGWREWEVFHVMDVMDVTVQVEVADTGPCFEPGRDNFYINAIHIILDSHRKFEF